MTQMISNFTPPGLNQRASRSARLYLLLAVLGLVVIAGTVFWFTDHSPVSPADEESELPGEPANAELVRTALSGEAQLACLAEKVSEGEPESGFVKEGRIRLRSAAGEGDRDSVLLDSDTGYYWREGEKSGQSFSPGSSPIRASIAGGLAATSSTSTAATSSTSSLGVEPVAMVKPHSDLLVVEIDSREKAEQFFLATSTECFSVEVAEELFQPPALVDFDQ